MLILHACMCTRKYVSACMSVCTYASMYLYVAIIYVSMCIHIRVIACLCVFI